MHDKHSIDSTIEPQSHHIEEGEDLTFEELLSVVGGLSAARNSYLVHLRAAAPRVARRSLHPIGLVRGRRTGSGWDAGAPANVRADRRRRVINRGTRFGHRTPAGAMRATGTKHAGRGGPCTRRRADDAPFERSDGFASDVSRRHDIMKDTASQPVVTAVASATRLDPIREASATGPARRPL